MSKFCKEFLLTLLDTGVPGAEDLENRIKDAIESGIEGKVEIKTEHIVILVGTTDKSKGVIKVKFTFIQDSLEVHR